MIEGILTVLFVAFAVYGFYKFLQNYYVKIQVFHWWLEEQRDALKNEKGA